MTSAAASPLPDPVAAEAYTGNLYVDDDVDAVEDDLDFDDDRDLPRRTPVTANRPWLSALALFGVVKLVGFASFMYLLDSAGDFRTKHPRFGGGAHVWDVLATWDGWWYRQIAENGYDPKLVYVPGGGEHSSIEQNSAAFFPLYPGLMRLVSDVTGLGSFGAGLVVSIVASFFAAAGIYAVVKILAGHRTAVLAAGLFAVWPGSGAEWAVYSDSLFVALAAWTLHSVMTRRWLTAGVLCMAAGMSRPSSVALIAAVGIAALLAAWRREDGILRPLGAMVMAPLGLIGYVAWVGWKAGNPRAFFLLESDAWDHYIDYGYQTFHAIRGLLSGKYDYAYANATEDTIAVAVIFLSVILLVLLINRRPPAVLIVFTVLTIVMTLSSHQIFGDISRYMLPAFPLLIPAAAALKRARTSALVTVFLVTAIASGSYAGLVLFELGIP